MLAANGEDLTLPHRPAHKSTPPKCPLGLPIDASVVAAALALPPPSAPSPPSATLAAAQAKAATAARVFASSVERKKRREATEAKENEKAEFAKREAAFARRLNRKSAAGQAAAVADWRQRAKQERTAKRQALIEQTRHRVVDSSRIVRIERPAGAGVPDPRGMPMLPVDPPLPLEPTWTAPTAWFRPATVPAPTATTATPESATATRPPKLAILVCMGGL